MSNKAKFTIKLNWENWKMEKNGVWWIDTRHEHKPKKCANLTVDPKGLLSEIEN